MNLYVLVILVTVISGNKDSMPVQPKGIYTAEKHIKSHEIVFPLKVTSLGNLISHNVTHYYDEEDSDIANNKLKQLTELHYRLMMNGSEYQLKLMPAKEFFKSTLIIERHKRSIHQRRPLKKHLRKCHYRGIIQGQPKSQVTISACDGLTGLIRGKHGEAWLEPVAREHKLIYTPNISSTEEQARPHLLFRKTHNDYANKLDKLKNLALEKKKLQPNLLHRSRRKLHSKSKKKYKRNCGTREPRRLTETLLEWQVQPGLVQVQGRGRRRHKIIRWKFLHQEQNRKRRSVSRPRNVETLVVADSTMMAFHQDGDVETYLLTIMNMVSALYLDPTIGNFINVVVVRIILLEGDEAEQGLNITINADKTLYNFCQWQQKLNPQDDSHPNHHDVAILITRKDICSRSNTPCSTLGVAHVAGMCQPDRSCSVNEDNGITLAHTITHELGHNFGMYHDTEKIGCSKRDGDKLHVMTPTFEADTVGVAWSKCSRRDITNFLDEGKGECLEDEPADSDYAYPDLPPGAMYNAEHQCRLQFAVTEAFVCSPLEEICSKLWCVIDGICTTMLHPAAPGTHCGKDMWCQNQVCVPIVDMPSQINGGWGDWGSWSECSRSCGAGVSIVERKCDHPEPAYGGKFCIGERRRYKICNTQPCPDGVPSFRSVQCSSYNRKEYKGRNYTWLPYFDQTEPCELYCTNTEESVIAPWGETALDGTPCNVGTRDMCIAGICRKVGCDWIVDSDATEDQCGICHGDGSHCVTIRGLYSKNEGSGYKEIITIPKNSRNIKIEEIGHSKNYISIGRSNVDEFFLNGKRQITLAGEYQVAGTLALYERDRDKEKVRIPGPIKEDIVVYLIYRSHYPNMGLRYEYTIPKEDISYIPVYTWRFSDWSSCTATCGTGTQTSHALCNEYNSGTVVDEFCNKVAKPDTLIRKCNRNPCPASWWAGPWQMCPVTCGLNELRKRSVICAVDSQGDDHRKFALPDSDCDKDMRPAEFELCPDLPKCGNSTEIPTLIYADSNNTDFYNVSKLNKIVVTSNIDDLEASEIEPEILEFDNIIEMNDSNKKSTYSTKPKWQISKWSLCLAGRRTRKVLCSMSGQPVLCSLENKPSDVEECNTDTRTTDCKDSSDPVRICSTYRRACNASTEARGKCFKKRKRIRHNRRPKMRT